MKLKLNENTLNAYINEAIEQEINEGGWNKIANFATRKAGEAAAKKTTTKAARVVGHAPRTKTPFNFASNIKNAKGARLALRDFKNGKPLEMSVQGSKNASYNGQKFWVKKVDGKVRFFSDPSCKAEYLLTTEKGGLGAAARSSWNSELSHMKNVLNSARRNMAGTLGVAGAFGAGYGLGTNGEGGQKDPNAPWNDNNGENQGNENKGGFDGTFPWDNTEPRWTPKPTPKPVQPSPKPAPVQPEPTQNNVPQNPRTSNSPLERIESGEMNLPGGASQMNQTGLSGGRPQPTIAQSAIHTMTQTTNANDNRPLQNRASLNRRTATNAKNIINQSVQNGSMSNQNARGQRQQINQAKNSLNRTGQPINK